MHEIYLLAVLFNASRHRIAERTREQRLRDEQAFYDLHSGNRRPGSGRNLARLAPVLPILLVASAALIGLIQLRVH